MNIDALFCDGTGNYVIPPEPKKMKRFAFVSGRQKMMLIKYFCLLVSSSYEMEKKETRGTF